MGGAGTGVGVGDGCSCDPAVDTTDCTSKPCEPFFTTFLVLELIVLLSYITLFIVIEVRTRDKKKSNLWRIVLIFAGLGCLAKVLRLGILANPHTRFEVGLAALLFLYNTHLCFGYIAFVSLLFFWMRLKHDLVMDNKLFGKLKPIYVGVIIFTVIFYYAQVIVQATSGDTTVMFYLMLMNGVVCFVLAVAFIIYGIVIWREFLKESEHNNLFFRIYVSALTAAVLIIAFVIELAVSNITNFNSTNQYLIKHSIYETLFVAQFISIPAGFVVHYYKFFLTGEGGSSGSTLSNSQHSLNKSSSMKSFEA